MSERKRNLPTTATTSSGLPVKLDDLAGAAIGLASKARADATLRAYASDWRDFLEWCQATDRTPLPADVGTVRLYVAALTERKPVPFSLATIQRRVAAISAMHSAKGKPTPTKEPEFRETMKGIRRKLSKDRRDEGKPAQNRARPITFTELRILTDRLGDGPKGIRDRALLLVGFHAALRRSELVALRWEDVREDGDGLRVSVRHSKTDQNSEGAEVGIRRMPGPRVCAVAALRAWREESGQSVGPIFRSVTKGGKLRTGSIGGGDVDRIIRALAKKAAKLGELDSVQGFSAHGLRAGLATTAAISGASETSIMKQGRWRSRAMVDRYVRPATVFDNNVGDAMARNAK